MRLSFSTSAAIFAINTPNLNAVKIGDTDLSADLRMHELAHLALSQVTAGSTSLYNDELAPSTALN